MDRFKYTRTYHLPFTETATSDDKMLDIKSFDARIKGKEILITEKMDGENTTLYSDGYSHARSIDSNNHPSRNWIKQFWAQRFARLPEGWRVCGENLYARHSIGYDNLPSYFAVFAIFDETNTRLHWNSIVDWCVQLNMSTVPVIYRGLCNDNWQKLCKDLFDKTQNRGGEGIVITTADGFPYDQHSDWIAKAVRKNHVQTDQHWMAKEIVPNKLAK